MALLYLEDFCESIETVPQDVKHAFATMRGFDLRVQNTLDTLDKRLKMFFATARKKTPEQRDKELQEIKKEHAKALEAADEKITIANTTYDLVDRHIRRLEIEVRKFAAELESTTPGVTSVLERKSLELDRPGDRSDAQQEVTPMKRKFSEAMLQPPQQVLPPPPTAGGMAMATLTPSSKAGTPMQMAKKNRSYVRKLPKQVPLPIESEAAVEPAPTAEEQRFCICNEVSYGEMVACDNEECPLEWFHYGCVGISEPPKGKWYCPQCIVNMKRRARLQ